MTPPLPGGMLTSNIFSHARGRGEGLRAHDDGHDKPTFCLTIQCGKKDVRESTENNCRESASFLFPGIPLVSCALADLKSTRVQCPRRTLDNDMTVTRSICLISTAIACSVLAVKFFLDISELELSSGKCREMPTNPAQDSVLALAPNDGWVYVSRRIAQLHP